MGYIYKITCKTTNKIYVGQTRTSVEQRWKDHCRSAQLQSHGDYNFPFHRAIRKYGKDDFLVEQIEECNNLFLDEREIYWIKYYDSYNNGYNASIGGLGHQKYNYDEIVNYYLQHNFSLVETCKYFKVYDQVVYSALKSKNIDYKNLGQKTGFSTKKDNKRIYLVEENLIFKSIGEIDKYFNKTVHPNIRRCLNGITKKAYGYHWRELEEGEIINNGKEYTPDMVYIGHSLRT